MNDLQTSGGQISDNSGNGYSGNIINNPSSSVGIVNGPKSSLDFSDTSSRIEWGTNNPIDGLSDYTISGWVKGGESDEYWLSLANSSTDNEMIWETFGTDEWNFCAVTRESGSGTAYVNAEIDSSFLYSNDFGGDPLNVEGFVLAEEQDSVLGGYNAGQAHTGKIDDIRVYDRALSQSEVRQLYEKQRPTVAYPSLVAWYPFDEAGAEDKSQNSNNGTVNGATFQPGGRGKKGAYDFDGSNNSIGISSSVINGESTLSISAWAFSDDSNDTFDNWRWIVGANNVFLFGGKNGSDDIRVHWNGNSSTIQANIAQKTWNFWTLTVETSSINAYINGNFQGSISKSGSLNISSSDNPAIGQRIDLSETWNGEIDDVRIYNKALSEKEIKLIYEKTK
jgi:hypothetical protein